MKEYSAVILGGGKGIVNQGLPKGNTQFNGNSLAGRVYASAISGFDFNEVAVLMNPDDKIRLRDSDFYVEPTYCKGAWMSGYNGIKKLGADIKGYVLVAGDLAFFKPSTMKAFMSEIYKSNNSDIIIPLVNRKVNEKMFPQRDRTYMPLNNGEFLAGNMGYISNKALQKNEYLVRDITKSYQKKIKFILMAFCHLGINTVLRSNHPKLPFIKSVPHYQKIFPKLSIQELNERASKFADVNVKFLEFPYPEASFDIDKLEQLHMADELNSGGLELITASSAL